MKESETIEIHDTIKAVTSDIWHNLIKPGHQGTVVDILPTGYKVYFHISVQHNYQDMIFGNYILIYPFKFGLKQRFERNMKYFK
jgi:hypothetical protein